MSVSLFIHEINGLNSGTIIAGVSEDVGSINFAERHSIRVYKVRLQR